MFHAIPMQRISIHLISEDVPLAALLLADTGCFAPYQDQLKEQEALTEKAGQDYHELYHAAHTRFNKIMTHASKKFMFPEISADYVPDKSELVALNERLTDIWSVFSDYEERSRILDERSRLLNNLMTTLTKFTGLDLDLGKLRKDKKFLDMRVGALPEQNLTRFTQAVSLAGYILKVFHRHKGQVYVVIAGILTEHVDELHLVLNAASFSSIYIPPEFHDKPEILLTEMETESRQITTARQDIYKSIQQSVESYKSDIIEAWRVLSLIEPHIMLGGAIHTKGGLSVINGWIPENELPKLRETLPSVLPHASYIDAYTPQTTEYSEVPSVVCYPGWVRSFARLVRNYGTPRYGEFDPTWIFMVTSVLMFGAMFGDVGHGATITLMGLIFRRKLKDYTSLITLNGISSIVFGLFYGSVFGDEHILTPLWHSPLHDPIQMLMIAFYFGIGFIAAMMMINIRNRIMEGRRQEAFFSSNGLAGIALMAGLYGLIYSWFGSGQNYHAYILLLLASMGFILHHSWNHSDESISERPIIVGIELFEAIMGILSNTLSFLRIAAFSLNHVALMIAIFTIANMMDTVGQWVTLIVGNAIVIGFEGAIVMIQILRLEYYEGLSRYYRGDGKLFKPLVFTDAAHSRCCYI